ncbi:hypothetical protein [Candidatus Poriferisodalis sp.]|uniref:hypothetical protein n=1 Tax=Candidatus Poriferisodalis sp. TaxID=3101277 RepID=UPI003D0D13B4
METDREAVSIEVPGSRHQSAEVTSTTQPWLTLERDDDAWRRFENGAAPQWPFVGLVQLWVDAIDTSAYPNGRQAVWRLRYWDLRQADAVGTEVPLRGFSPVCPGRIALVSSGPDGIEIGEAGSLGKVSYLVPWGETARRIDKPSEALVAEVHLRPSNVAAALSGDVLSLESGGSSTTHVIRQPRRLDGHRWSVQARHDGDLFVVTVHPAHLGCYSGVTWLSLASTGEVLVCGANTWATKFIAPTDQRIGELVLPDSNSFGTVLDCAPKLDVAYLPLAVKTRSSR